MRSRIILAIMAFYVYFSYAYAQKEYFYYSGKQMQLSINNNIVCLSIPKTEKVTRDKILSQVKVEKIVNDDKYDIFVISKSDFNVLTSTKNWEGYKKRIIATNCYMTPEQAIVYSTPYINVRLKDAHDFELLQEYSKSCGFDIIRNVPLMPLWYILSVSPNCNMTPLECANYLCETGLFEESIADFCSDDIELSSEILTPNDPLINQQWGLSNNTYNGVDVSAFSAWDYATGNGVKIAILDTGVDMDHIDLSANISTLSYDTETYTSPSICYLDHATHCAGIAAAVKDNGILVAGVAPNAEIVSISNRLQPSTNSNIKRANGIVWAYNNGVDIISNSWFSSTPHAAIDEAINNAFVYGRQGKGCIVVFASGNQSNSNIVYPANCNDLILAVGSISINGTRYSSSNYGDGLDLVAPGVNVLSTLPNNSSGFKTGTSMACPHVSSVAALILERNPMLTVNQVNTIINSNAKKLSGVNFNVTKPDGTWNNEYGYGLVDAYEAVINTPTTRFIQNETITGNTEIEADSIFVGRNVTNIVPNGNVTLGQGNIILRGNYIHIKNSTTVPLGTILKIGNQ